ncbi:MAG: hypothetical protein U0167_14025 [bacterium]
MRAACLPLVPALAPLAAVVFALGARTDVASATEPFVSNPIGEAFPLVFDSEWIWLDVVGDTLEVRGTYVLVCRAAVKEPTPLFYPFPQDSLLGGARMVSLTYRSGGFHAPASASWEELPGSSGVRWWIPPCAGDSVVAEAVYHQKIVTGYARYIVTTARTWGKPLRYASFEIRLPPGVEPLDFSYPFERRVAPGGTYFVYETTGFFPDRDIIVRWRR